MFASIPFFAAMSATAKGLITAGSIIAGSVLLGFVVDRILVRGLRNFAANTEGKLDDIIANSVKGISRWVAVLIGVYYALPYLPIPEALDAPVTKAARVLVLVMAVTVVARFASGVAVNYAHKVLPSSASLAKIVVNATVFIIGLLIIFSWMGIQIAPVLTALGVGGLAVALALQDTLANFFAGIQILASKQVRPGDYVRIDAAHEGVIHDIGWRTTTLRMLRNNFIIVPNTKLAQAIVTNFTVPERELGMSIPLGVAYGSDLVRVEEVAVEVAREVVTRVEGAVREFEPLVRFNAFGDSAIQMDVILRTREFTDQGLIRHEMIKSLQQRFAAEGIEIPFPIRTVHLRDDRPRGQLSL
jgi:small-conductance mechanosensitive channel